MSKDPGNKLKKNSQEQQAEAANGEARHPGSSFAFSYQRKSQRDKPHE
jgi:hypothetical protein